jgi:hypothetical protein
LHKNFGTSHWKNIVVSPPAQSGMQAPSELLRQMTVVYVVEVPRAQDATPVLSHLCIESRPNYHGPELSQQYEWAF